MNKLSGWFLGAMVTFAGTLSTGCVSHRFARAEVAVEVERLDTQVVRVEHRGSPGETANCFWSGMSARTWAHSTRNRRTWMFRCSKRGTELRESRDHFAPQQIPHGHQMHGHSRFYVPLGELPPATAVIRVVVDQEFPCPTEIKPGLRLRSAIFPPLLAECRRDPESKNGESGGKHMQDVHEYLTNTSGDARSRATPRCSIGTKQIRAGGVHAASSVPLSQHA
jgi:hypothetical protein